MYNIGICFGGYCPMHRGHLDVIMKAKKQCDKVLLVVCGYDDEERAKEIGLDLSTRYGLVKKFFKDDEQIIVVKINDGDLGILENVLSENNWRIWTNEVNRLLTIHMSNVVEKKLAYNVTYYVAEERYKDDLENIGQNVCLIERKNPISGTNIRKNPLIYFDQIVKTFQPYFVKNILIIGTASEGKTTLVNDISRYYNIPKTVEYGRIYMEEKNKTDVDLNANDFHQFISGQYDEYVKAINNASKGLTIQDTDNLVTLMYAKAYVEDPNIEIGEKGYRALVEHAKSIQKYFEWDHIFVLIPNNPNFVDDGSRYMKQASMKERKKNMEKLEKLIDEFGIDRRKLTYLNGGEFEINFLTVKEYIDRLYEY